MLRRRRLRAHEIPYRLMSRPDEPVDSPGKGYIEIVRDEEERLLRLLRGLPSGVRGKVQGGISRALIAEPLRIDTPRGPLSFVILGASAAVRARNLLTKQPATIAWIDTFRPDSAFWDIGANIGSYTLYAALGGDLRVVAFEPAAVNYFLLAANCELNGFGEGIDCLQIGVGNDERIGHLEISQFEPGASFSFRGKEERPFSSRQAAFIMSMDRLVDTYGLPCPNYIKIDVPALTEAIIEGGTRTLDRAEVRELHVEMRETSPTGRRLVERLAQHGFIISARSDRGGTTDLTFAKQG